MYDFSDKAEQHAADVALYGRVRAELESFIPELCLDADAEAHLIMLINDLVEAARA